MKAFPPLTLEKSLNTAFSNEMVLLLALLSQPLKLDIRGKNVSLFSYLTVSPQAVNVSLQISCLLIDKNAERLQILHETNIYTFRSTGVPHTSRLSSFCMNSGPGTPVTFMIWVSWSMSDNKRVNEKTWEMLQFNKASAQRQFLKEVFESDFMEQRTEIHLILRCYFLVSAVNQ